MSKKEEIKQLWATFIKGLIGAILFPQNIWVVVVAGGRGTRLFPHSHDDCPKQFCLLDSVNTFIQATIKRYLALGIKANHIVVVTTNSRQSQLAREQLLPLGVISPNIIEISPSYGYAGSMVKAAEFIHRLDKKAVIINTPSDQYIDANDEFMDTLKLAICTAATGKPTIVGVKVGDEVVFSGCGHAIFDPNDTDLCRKVTGFVEKPDIETTRKLMYEENSACNTGINVWRAIDVLNAIDVENLDRIAHEIDTGERDGETLGTDELMDSLGELRLAHGNFSWLDCGTLKALYTISDKSADHENAILGPGYIERINCCRSLFITMKGVNLYAMNAEDVAIVLNRIHKKIFVAVVALEESQLVKKLAEDFERNRDILTNDYTIKGRNNMVIDLNSTNEICAGYVGVNNYIVVAVRTPDGEININVTRTLTKMRDVA